MGEIVKLHRGRTQIAEVYLVDMISLQLGHSVSIGLSLEIEGFETTSGKADHPAMTCVFFNPFQFTKTIFDEGLDDEKNGFRQFIDGLEGIFISESSKTLQMFQEKWSDNTPDLDSAFFKHFIITADSETISIIAKEMPKILYAKAEVEALFAAEKKLDHAH